MEARVCLHNLLSSSGSAAMASSVGRSDRQARARNSSLQYSWNAQSEEKHVEWTLDILLFEHWFKTCLLLESFIVAKAWQLRFHARGHYETRAF